MRFQKEILNLQIADTFLGLFKLIYSPGNTRIRTPAIFITFNYNFHFCSVFATRRIRVRCRFLLLVLKATISLIVILN